jgi:hypothetical protein
MEWIFENWTALALGLITFADLVVSLHPRWDGKKLGYLRALVLAFMAQSEAKKKPVEKIEKRRG